MPLVPALPDLPPGLIPAPDMIVVGRPASFYDQVHAYATQDELGIAPTPAADVVAITQLLPFWPTIRFLARFQRDLWAARVDQARQLGLLHAWFGKSEFAARAEAWLKQSPQRVLFSEQQLFALQRLVFLNSLDGPLDEQFSDQQSLGLLVALSAVPGSVLPSGEPGESGVIEDEEWLRFFVGHGGFIGRGALRNELGRAFRLYHDSAQSPEVAEHQDFVPLNDWLVAEYGLTLDELQAAAFAIHAGSKMLSDDEPPTLIDASYFSTTQLADRAERALDALSAPREWFVERFMATQDDPRRAAFEITPFLQRPALRQPDGMVMPLAPRALEAWMGATGSHYRLFDIARAKGSATRKKYSRFNGVLVEQYAVELARAAFPVPDPKSAIWTPGAVHRDRAYPAKGGERRTPDVVIDLTPDVIVIEITGSRPTQESIVDADPEAVRSDIQKLLVDKIEQLGDAIKDLRSGTAVLPDMNMSHVDRIWPILVSSEGLLQTPILWQYLHSTATGALHQPGVQPLTLFDLEDLEEFFGIVADDRDAIAVLRRKTEPQWREREFAVWCRAPGNEFFSGASPIARAQFESAADAMARTLMGSAEAAEFATG